MKKVTPKLVVALLFLGLNFYIYHYLATEEVFPPRVSFSQFPLELGAWNCRSRERMDARVEATLRVTDYLVCNYSRRGASVPVGVYVGYNKSQVRREGGGNESMIHPPAHCLPGSGWDIIDASKVALDLPGLPGAPAEINRLIIAKGEQRQVVYYWYQERGRVIARDWEKIVDLFWSRATRHRTDGALVRFTAPVLGTDEKSADAAFHDLASQIVPLLPAYIPG
jgi:EpsI family protein